MIKQDIYYKSEANLDRRREHSNGGVDHAYLLRPPFIAEMSGLVVADVQEIDGGR